EQGIVARSARKELDAIGGRVEVLNLSRRRMTGSDLRAPQAPQAPTGRRKRSARELGRSAPAGRERDQPQLLARRRECAQDPPSEDIDANEGNQAREVETAGHKQGAP